VRDVLSKIALGRPNPYLYPLTSGKGRGEPERPFETDHGEHHLTNFRTFGGKATLPEPWEVAAHVCDASKTKSFNRFGANVRDGFFNRIRRINQL
jgi:hypothetical protein